MTAPPELDQEGGPDQGADPEAPTFGDPVTPNRLLDPATPPKDVVRYLHDAWAAQKDKHARRLAEHAVNKRRRSGEGNLWVEKDPNQAIYRVYEAIGPTRYSQFYQKANRLALRTVAVLHTDPPKPEAIPRTGEADDRDGAELATRLLEEVTSESGLNQVEAHKQAFDWASNGGSAYVWYFTDPTGGGRQPIEVDAHPLATSIDQVQPVVLDPTTGAEWNGDTVSRFVRPDGSLTPQRSEAARRWVPKVTREVVEFGHVRLLPHTATDVWDATGLLYAAYHTWGTLKAWFPTLAEVSDEERDHAIKARGKDCDHLLPQRLGKKFDPPIRTGHEDEGLALLMCYWAVEQPEFPDGAYIVTVGDRLAPHRGPWMIDGAEGPEPRDLPFTQVMQWRADKDTPGGYGMMDFLGPSNENLGEVTVAILEMLDKGLNPITLLPLGSTIQEDDLDSPFNTTLRFQPGFEPKRFEGPRVPPEAITLRQEIAKDMNDATGMGQASAEGLEGPDVQSGRHALAIQAAQQASLSDLNQNVNRAFVRGWRLIAQCIKADYDVPQLVQYVDRDGSYKVRRFLGSDLASVRDFQVVRGTGTLFNPAQKAQYVAEYAQLVGLQPEDVKELLATGYQPYTTLQDDPHLLRVRRQIARWEEGPPEGWAPPPPPQPVVLGVDPASGEPVLGPPPGPPPPYDPVFGADPRLVDMTPIAAKARIRELGEAMAGMRYGAFPPEWRFALDQEFQRMQQALAPAPAPAPPAGPREPKGSRRPGEPPPLQEGEAAVLGDSVGQPAGAVPPPQG